MTEPQRCNQALLALEAATPKCPDSYCRCEVNQPTPRVFSIKCGEQDPGRLIPPDGHWHMPNAGRQLKTFFQTVVRDGAWPPQMSQNLSWDWREAQRGHTSSWHPPPCPEPCFLWPLSFTLLLWDHSHRTPPAPKSSFPVSPGIQSFLLHRPVSWCLGMFPLVCRHAWHDPCGSFLLQGTQRLQHGVWPTCKQGLNKSLSGSD